MGLVELGLAVRAGSLQGGGHVEEVRQPLRVEFPPRHGLLEGAAWLLVVVAVSEATWLTDERPKEIFDFWNNAYPQIDTISNKIAQMQKAGYLVMASFILPEFCWTDNFYTPAIAAQKIFLDKYRGNKSAEEFIKYEKYGAELYNKYKQYYGYVFYIGKKM